MPKTNVIEIRTPFYETPCGVALAAALEAARANDRSSAGIAALSAAAQYTGDPDRFRLLIELNDEIETQLKLLLIRAEFNDKVKPEIEELRARKSRIQPELMQWVEGAWTYQAQAHADRSWTAGRKPIAELVRRRYILAVEELATAAEEVIAECNGVPRPLGVPVPIIAEFVFPDGRRFSALTAYAHSLRHNWGIEWDPTAGRRSGGMPPAA